MDSIDIVEDNGGVGVKRRDEGVVVVVRRRTVRVKRRRACEMDM